MAYCGNCGRRLVDEAGGTAADVDLASGSAEIAAPTGARTTTNGTAADGFVGAGSEVASSAQPVILGRRGRILRRRFGRRPTVASVRLAVVVIAATLALIALLADEAGLALVVAAVAAPLLLVESLIRRDVFDRLKPAALLAVAATGIVAGAVIGALSVIVTDNLWLDDRRVDVASLGLGARAADGDGSPPILVLALSGLLLPAAGVGLAMAAPLYLRRWAAFRNEVMDGVIFGAAAGGGYATGLAIAYLWPLLGGDAIAGDVPEWTVAAIGVILLRPVILVATAALVGAAIWRYDLTGRGRDLLVPLAAGLAWAIAYAFVSLFAGGWQPTVGLVWSAGVLIAVTTVGRSVVNEAVRHDRRWLTEGHVVCPTCRSVTPAGKFCSACRAPLSHQSFVASR